MEVIMTTSIREMKGESKIEFISNYKEPQLVS